MPIAQSANRYDNVSFDSISLVQSDDYELKTWRFPHALPQTVSGYNDCFCIILVQTGRFQLNVSRNSHLPHSGHVIIDKPDSDFELTASTCACTIISFSNTFYKNLLEEITGSPANVLLNSNILSFMLSATAETEYFHYRLINPASAMSRLEIDTLVFELLNHVMELITMNDTFVLPVKSDHLHTVESAKEYINENFAKDISLAAIAGHACVSPFHFLRIFKCFTSYTPYKYLLNIRLKHAELLLKNTALPIADISFASGFKSSEYFSTAFKHKYKFNPSQYRSL